MARKLPAVSAQSLRPDGSWPIDTNLSVWLTTASVTALAAAGALSRIDGPRTARWIADRQCRTPHPYTGAAPGGWAWTHLPGGVPDADDTAGAIIALTNLEHPEGVAAGIRWLLDLQNRDGGWPTFCRGWEGSPSTACAGPHGSRLASALWRRCFGQASPAAARHPERAKLSAHGAAARRILATALVWKPESPRPSQSGAGHIASAKGWKSSIPAAHLPPAA